jgi:translocation and assembly module TamA
VKPARRKVIVVAGVVVALIATAAVVVHLPGVQRSVWHRLSASIEEDTGWRIAAESFAFRGWPARLRMSGVTADNGGRTVASLDRVEVRWSWLGLSRTPRRLERLILDGLDVDLDALPEQSTTGGDSTISLWELIEIGELRVLGSGGSKSIPGIDVAADGLNIEGRLVSGSGTAEITAQRLLVTREGRPLDLGSVEIVGRGSRDGLQLERLEIGSAEIGLSVTGRAEFLPSLNGRFDVNTEADVAVVAHWWDPNLATGLEPRGRLELEGQVAVTDAEGVTVELSHRGQILRVAGYDLEELDLAFAENEPTVRAAHPDWGRVSVTMTAPGVADVAATLDEAPIDRLLAFAAPRVADVIGQPATLSGEIDGTASFPILPEFLAGHIDLEMRSPLGQFGVRANGAGLSWRVAHLTAQAKGATLSANGRLDDDGSVSGEGLLTASDSRRIAEAAEIFLPALRELEIGGGPIESRFRVGGSLSEPSFSASLEWTEAVIAGHVIGGVAAEASGGLDGVQWQMGLTAGDQTSLEASGSAIPRDGSANGRWRFQADSLEELMAIAAVSPEIPVEGRIGGEGRFEASGDGIRVEGTISTPEIAAGEWTVGNVRAELAATPDTVMVKGLSAEAYSGTVEGSLTVSLAGLSAPASADIRWRNVALGEIPIDLPETAAGIMAGRLRLGGSPARPQGDLELSWLPPSSTSLVGEVGLLVNLTDGRLSMASERIESAAGAASVELIAPLGDLPLPEWLWTDAPGGPVQMTAKVPAFSSGPLQEMLGLEGIQVVAEADLRAELVWDALAPGRPRVFVEARDLRLLHPSGNLVAEGPLVVSVDDDRIQLDPVALVGLGSRIEASAIYDPATELVDGRLRARLAPEVVAMMPLPVILEGPMTVNADFEVPADRAMSATAVRGEFTIYHDDGRMVMRDPPVEIRDLRAVVRLEEGVLDILEGSAEVNRGHVELGGGWDPESGQGLVLELDKVTTMVEGILTQWDGYLAIEPHPDRLAHLSGDLTLVAGLWDERFDVASAMVASPSTMTPEDEILHDIGLDMTVHGLAGIKVENNLGRFDVNWDRLRVAGTAGAPVLRGELRIAPGGVLALAGQEVEVRRGVVEFTGNPDIDPLMEIVPVSGTTLFGDEEGIDATEMATRGVAQGVSSALGFENETLRPAEIAVQTETDPSVRFMVGQRLSRQLALFLAFNLTDVQDRLTMLQYWNLPRFKGLALQAYQETADENLGANIFQRFEWGGSKTLTDRPEIHRLRLEGEWPLSKRGLRKATRLRRGQPFDPFLLFVGAVRMERMLAEHGYQNARVSGVQAGREGSPTLVFTCDPGVPRHVRFEGDSLPARVRREVTAMYRGPPLESGAFENMVSEVRRHVVGEGFLASDIEIERRDKNIVVSVRKGEKTELEGPFFDGMPVDAVMPAFRALAPPEALALTVNQPDWAVRVVERILKNAGFFEAEVLDVRMDATDPSRAEVHIVVSAGEREVVKSVEILGSDPLGLTADSGFPVRPGVPLDRTAIDAAAREIRHTYIEEGYREARVEWSIRDDDDRARTVDFSLDPGRQRTVREIRFTGHRGVSEKVLRKGVTLAPGEVLTDEDLDLSASQIANFSPIEADRVEVVPVGSTRADVEFGVVEKRRWTVEVGGGWSTERSFGAAFGARDDNLFGRGIGLNLRGSIDAVEKKIFLLGSIPPVPGGRLSFITTIGFSTGDAPYDPEDLNQDQKLASLEASFRLSENVQIGTYYRWTDTRTYEKVPDEFIPFDSTLQVGTLGARTIIERFDYLFDPRSGWGLTSDLGWSGEAIGSELEFVSWLTGFSLALEPFRDATWMQALRLGVAEPLKGTNLHPDARFFAGGQASVRGFDLNTVGPESEVTGEPEGGGALFILNQELRIPIWDPLRLAVFADIGQVWESWREADTSFSVGVGIGVRWSTPIGPLWADVAWPVVNVGISSRKPKFYLGIGRPF